MPTAGRGTRLRSTIPTGLVPVGGMPMIKHAILAADQAGIRQKVFVLKYRADVQQEYRCASAISWSRQRPRETATRSTRGCLYCQASARLSCSPTRIARS